MRRHAYYPVFLDLQGRRCVVIGGGHIAQRKVTTLLSYGARVTVISPAVTPRLAAYAKQSKIRHVRRRLCPSDLQGAWLIYAATDEQTINQLVARVGLRRRIFTNVVDQPHLCSFIAPAIMQRGAVTVAISTGGASPVMAKRIRNTVARAIQREDVAMVQLLASLRPLAKARLQQPSERKRYFEQLVKGKTYTLVRSGSLRAARRTARELLERSADSKA